MGLQVSIHLGRGTQCRQQGSRNTNREPGKASYMFKAALTPAWDNRANDRAMPGSLELCRLAPAGQPALGSCSSSHTRNTPPPHTHTHTHTHTLGIKGCLAKMLMLTTWVLSFHNPQVSH